MLLQNQLQIGLNLQKDIQKKNEYIQNELRLQMEAALNKYNMRMGKVDSN